MGERGGRRRSCVVARSRPASRTGHSVRVIGYSGTAGVVLTVILIRPAADPDDPPDGDWWGGNAWIANKRDQRTYGEADHGQD